MSKSPEQILDREEIKAGLRRLRNLLTRRARRMPAARGYLLQGGPFDGKEIFLQTRSTCRLVIGEWRGRYVETSDRGAMFDRRPLFVATWEDSSNA